jgi:hypothetical protein
MKRLGFVGTVHLHTFKGINQPDAAIIYRFIVCRLDTAQRFFNVTPCMLPHLFYNPTHALLTL